MSFCRRLDSWASRLALIGVVLLGSPAASATASSEPRHTSEAPAPTSGGEKPEAEDCLSELTETDRKQLTELAARIEQIKANIKVPKDRATQLNKLGEEFGAKLSHRAKAIALAQAKRVELETLAAELATNADFNAAYTEHAQAVETLVKRTEQAAGSGFWAHWRHKDSAEEARVAEEKAFSKLMASLAELKKTQPESAATIQKLVLSSSQALYGQLGDTWGRFADRMELRANVARFVRDGAITAGLTVATFISVGSTSAAAAGSSVRALAAGRQLITSGLQIGSKLPRGAQAVNTIRTLTLAGSAAGAGLPTAKRLAEAGLNSQSLGTSFACELSRSFADSDALTGAFKGAITGAAFGAGLTYLPGAVVMAGSGALAYNSARNAVKSVETASSYAPTEQLTEAQIRERNATWARAGEETVETALAMGGARAGYRKAKASAPKSTDRGGHSGSGSGGKTSTTTQSQNSSVASEATAQSSSAALRTASSSSSAGSTGRTQSHGGRRTSSKTRSGSQARSESAKLVSAKSESGKSKAPKTETSRAETSTTRTPLSAQTLGAYSSAFDLSDFTGERTSDNATAPSALIPGRKPQPSSENSHAETTPPYEQATLTYDGGSDAEDPEANRQPAQKPGPNWGKLIAIFLVAVAGGFAVMSLRK